MSKNGLKKVSCETFQIFKICVTPEKILPHFFTFLAHFLAFTPPVCGFISKSFLRNISKLLNINVQL